MPTIGKVEREDAAFPRQITHLNVAAERPAGTRDDGQAKPDPGSAGRATDESSEQLIRACGKAAALILHLDDETAVHLTFSS
jgi:hypothetical protein